jgi:hypothetical protein
VLAAETVAASTAPAGRLVVRELDVSALDEQANSALGWLPASAARVALRASLGQAEVPCAGTCAAPITRALRALNSWSLIAPESSSTFALAISSAGDAVPATCRT